MKWGDAQGLWVAYFGPLWLLLLLCTPRFLGVSSTQERRPIQSKKEETSTSSMVFPTCEAGVWHPHRRRRRRRVTYLSSL